MVKACGGMLIFALAPAACVYTLADAQKKGNIRKPNLDTLKRHAHVEDLQMPPPREEVR